MILLRTYFLCVCIHTAWMRTYASRQRKRVLKYADACKQVLLDMPALEFSFTEDQLDLLFQTVENNISWLPEAEWSVINKVKRM